MTSREPTLSTRLLSPYARLLRAEPRVKQELAELGLDAVGLADPDRRVVCRVAFDGLERAARAVGDPALGLRAGLFGSDDDSTRLLDHALRCTSTLGAALQVAARYLRVMLEGSELWLDRHADHPGRPLVCCTAALPYSPLASDFVIATVHALAARNSESYGPAREVWLSQRRPSHADLYQELFQAPVRFGAVCDALVLSDEQALQVPMKACDGVLAAALERQARELTQDLPTLGNTAQQVRAALASQLMEGNVSLRATARRLGVEVAALRGRLDAEGCAFGDLLDELRCAAATRQLSEPNRSLGEVAFALGFSDVRVFARELRRWTGVTPSEFRARRAEARGTMGADGRRT